MPCRSIVHAWPLSELTLTTVHNFYPTHIVTHNIIHPSLQLSAKQYLLRRFEEHSLRVQQLSQLSPGMLSINALAVSVVHMSKIFIEIISQTKMSLISLSHCQVYTHIICTQTVLSWANIHRHFQLEQGKLEWRLAQDKHLIASMEVPISNSWIHVASLSTLRLRIAAPQASKKTEAIIQVDSLLVDLH